MNGDVLATLLDRSVRAGGGLDRVDEHGQAYNVNADVVAGASSPCALGAEKLVYLNDVPGLIGPTGDLLSELSVVAGARAAVAPGVVDGGMIPKIESAVRALQAGRAAGRIWWTAGSSTRSCWSCSPPRASAP